MYVVPERNHAFPNPKHGVHSVLEIQAKIRITSLVIDIYQSVSAAVYR